LQLLEDRCVPSTLPVTNTLDDVTHPGSLRYAVAKADDGDTIVFSPALHGAPIVLNQGPLFVGRDVTIEARPDTPQTISGAGNVGPGKGNVGVFIVGAQVTLLHLNIIDSNSYYGTIANEASLTMSDCTMSGNTCVLGGAIYNEGTLTVNGCTLSGNSAEFGGGGIFNDLGATATICNSTLSGNSATIEGGGVYNNDGTLAVLDSVFCDNSPDNIFGLYTDEGGNTFC
jgi:hypothetical protein